MACKDHGLIPKDDYTNIEALYSKRILAKNLKSALMEANGLRNRLIHKYNALDEKIVFKAVKELLPRVEEFAKVMEKWLKKKL